MAETDGVLSSENHTAKAHGKCINDAVLLPENFLRSSDWLSPLLRCRCEEIGLLNAQHRRRVSELDVAICEDVESI